VQKSVDVSDNETIYGGMQQHIGLTIRRLRERKKLSARKLAQIAGVSQVSMIETGMRVGRLSTLAKIAKALGTTVGKLIDG
jgi:transcriptional regulator with XRE-family HTH domain